MTTDDLTQQVYELIKQRNGECALLDIYCNFPRQDARLIARALDQLKQENKINVQKVMISIPAYYNRFFVSND
jgi:hypothetical protein